MMATLPVLLRYEAPLANIKQQLADDRAFLQGLIGTYLLENNHGATVIMHPDAGYNQQLEANELARLNKAQSAMDDVALERVRAEADTLRLLQARTDRARTH